MVTVPISAYDLRVSFCHRCILLDTNIPEMQFDGLMDYRDRSRLLQRNEQVKMVSNLAGNAGLALMAAGAGRWFIEGLDGHVMPWLADGFAIIGAGVMLLTQIEAES